MDRKTEIKEILNDIHRSEEGELKYDENVITLAYEKQLENKSSLAIKVLSILGGLFATLTFLGFLFIAGLSDSQLGLSLFGIGFISVAIFLNKKFDQLIIDTFSISTYVIGFVLFGLGMSQMEVNVNLITGLVVLIALISISITQNYILSFISVLIIWESILVLIISNELFDLIHLLTAITAVLLTYWFLYEAKILAFRNKLSKLYDPIRIALIFSLLISLRMVGKGISFFEIQNNVWLSSIAIIIVIIYLVHVVSSMFGMKSQKDKIFIYSLSFLILIPTLFAPSISGAILIVLLSFRVNYKTGLVIGIISLIYFISQYYYDLNYTLLIKSIILFSSGLLFILFYLFINKKNTNNEEI